MNNNKYVNMYHVIGDLSLEYGVPIMSWDDLVTLGQRAVNVYGLASQARKIPFAELCEYICLFIKTPFGTKVLKELADK